MTRLDCVGLVEAGQQVVTSDQRLEATLSAQSAITFTQQTAVNRNKL